MFCGMRLLRVNYPPAGGCHLLSFSFAIIDCHLFSIDFTTNDHQ